LRSAVLDRIRELGVVRRVVDTEERAAVARSRRLRCSPRRRSLGACTRIAVVPLPDAGIVEGEADPCRQRRQEELTKLVYELFALFACVEDDERAALVGSAGSPRVVRADGVETENVSLLACGEGKRRAERRAAILCASADGLAFAERRTSGAAAG